MNKDTVSPSEKQYSNRGYMKSYFMHLVDHVLVCSQTDFVPELFVTNVAILLGSAWLMTLEMFLQFHLVHGSVTTDIALEWMSSGVTLSEVLQYLRE